MNLFHTTLTRFGDEFLACAKQTISTFDGGVDSIQREARGVGVIRVGFLRWKCALKASPLPMCWI